jgi:hypothetical protein
MSSATLNISILKALTKIVGDKYVLSDEYSYTLYVQSAYTKFISALTLVQLANFNEYTKVLKTEIPQLLSTLDCSHFKTTKTYNYINKIQTNTLHLVKD